MSHGPLGDGKMWVATTSMYFDDYAVRVADFRSRSLRWYRPEVGFPPLTRSWVEAAQRWADGIVRSAAVSLGALALLLLAGCASLTHEPGTPYGGAYCTQRGNEEAACYPSEAERAAAWREREAEGRRAWAAEHPEEARAEAAELARASDAFEARERARRAEVDAQGTERATEEAQRAAESAADAQARQAEADRLELARARAADPAYAIPALSALLCREQAWEAEFRADLQRQARIQAISGVVAKRERSSLAAGLVDAQDRSARLRKRLLAVGAAAPLACAAVAPLQACRAGDELSCRSERGARDVVDVLRQIEREP